MPKRPIRERLLAERRRCPVDECVRLSRMIQTRFLESDVYRGADVVGLYSPVQNEVRTGLVADRVLAEGKRLVYPRVRGEIVEFVEVADPARLVPGAFGIPEPVEGRVLALDEIDLLVIPGVAFDLSGHRLGYGKGYYDRTLEACCFRGERVGFAYEFQLVECLPAAAHDCRVSRLVTEQRLFHFPAGSPAGC